MPVRISLISKRVDKTGKHNDRNFDTSKAPHIISEKTKYNRYWLYGGRELTHEELVSEGLTLQKQELEFYKEHFQNHIRFQREKNIRNHHNDRNKRTNIENYHKSKLSRPEDLILQIGNCKNVPVTPELLWQISQDYRKKIEERCKEHCVILNISLHLDEKASPTVHGTPHIQVRRVWIAEDEKGFSRVAQEDALRELGFNPPNIKELEGRFNNRKMSFTEWERDTFQSICESYGLEIEHKTIEEETGTKQKNLTIREYKIKMMEEELKQREAEQKALADMIAEMFLTSSVYKGVYDDVIEKAKQKGQYEYFKTLMTLFTQEMQIFEKAHSKSQNEYMEMHINAGIERRFKEMDKAMDAVLYDYAEQKTVFTKIYNEIKAKMNKNVQKASTHEKTQDEGKKRR